MKKLLILIGLSVISIAVVVYHSYDRWLEKELKIHLEEVINKDPNQLYTYHFSSLDIDLLEESVELHGIEITPTKESFDSLLYRTASVRELFELNLNTITLLGLDVKEFIRRDIIQIKGVQISDPKFTYYYHPLKPKIESNLPLEDIFSEKLTAASLGKLLINDAQFTLMDITRSAPAITIQKLDIAVDNAILDTISVRKFFPVRHGAIVARAESLFADVAEDFSIKSARIDFNIAKRNIIIHDFHINPKYSQENFSKRYHIQKQWFALTVDSVMLENIDYDNLISSGEVVLPNVSLIQPTVALYKDKTVPAPPFQKKYLPASGFNNIEWPLRIDTLSLQNGYIAISEKSAITGRLGSLFFNNLNATVSGIATQSIPHLENHLTIKATGNTMGVAETSILLRFDLNSAVDSMWVTGKVGKVDAQVFNNVLNPLLAINISSGMIEGIDFSFKAMDTLSLGKMDMEYTNLKIEVLDPNRKETVRRGLFSLAANTVIRSNNLKENKSYIQGIINTNRALDKSVWPYLWLSVQSGLVSTIAPIKNSKETKQMQRAARKQLQDKQQQKD